MPQNRGESKAIRFPALFCPRGHRVAAARCARTGDSNSEKNGLTRMVQCSSIPTRKLEARPLGCNHGLPAGAVRGFAADVGRAWLSLLVGRERFMSDVRAETSDVINLVDGARAIVSVRAGYRL